MAVDATGNVTAAWTYRDGTHSLLQTATLPSGHDPAATGDPTVGWSAVATLGPGPTESAMYPDLAIGATGDAGIAYSVSRCAGCNMPEVALYSVRRGPTGNWTAPTVASERMYYVSNPRVALDASGRATIVYFGYGVEASRENADGTWPAAGQTVLYFPVPGASDGSWSAAKRLTDPTAPVDAYASRAAVSQDGSLAPVGWIDHYHFTVQVAQLAGGLQSATDNWTTTTIGKGTAFSSYLEVLNLEIGSGKIARAVWKNARTGTQWYAAGIGP